MSIAVIIAVIIAAGHHHRPYHEHRNHPIPCLHHGQQRGCAHRRYK